MSKIEVNAVEPQCGTTLTLGESGDTVTLGAGASQSGFGRTGTVDWQTTPKTGNFTAANGEGYFVNTTSGAITMTMPSGSAGAIVSIQDYNKTFDTNNLTITPASGEKINGGIADGNLIINTEGQGLTFVYVDSTVGWKTVHENEFVGGGSNFIVASGGTETTCGNCKIHTFTGPGTFTVSQIATTCAPTNNVISYMVVAGGGGGGAYGAGGGGSGGFRETKSPVTPYTASPKCGYGTPGNRITVTATSFPITVGGGGSASGPARENGGCGSNSIFSTITSAGGGFGAGINATNGGNGGSGGGGSGGGPPGTSNPSPGGSGNTPSVTPSQGNNGGGGFDGQVTNTNGGGGGGASAVGSNAASATGGNGGNGTPTSISGSATTYAGGGGGGTDNGSGSPGGTAGTGGTGGGGNGANNQAGSPSAYGTAGTANTGGGGGGGGRYGPGESEGGAGGSGIVIIRYKFQ